MTTVLQQAMPSAKRRMTGYALGTVADLMIIGLMALSLWLIIRAGEQPPILHLTFAIVGVRALAIGRAVFRYLERLASHDSALHQLATLRAESFTRLVPRMPAAMTDHTTGDVHASLVDDIDQLQDQPLRVWQPLVVSLVSVTLAVTVITLVSPLAGLTNIGFLCIAAIVSWWLVTRFSRRDQAEITRLRGALTDALIERFEASTVLRVFEATSQQDDRILAISTELSRLQRRSSGVLAAASAVIALMAGFTSIVILLVLGSAASHSAALLGALVIVPAAIFEVFGVIPMALQARMLVKESAARVGSLLDGDLPTEIPNEKSGASPDLNTASFSLQDPLLRVRDLSVRYPGDTSPVISGVSFDLHAGETLVISGESGAGKSTLALALVRFLEYEGEAQLLGHEMRTLSTHAVRSVIGLSEQIPHLFDADLRQNLLFAKPDAGDDELLEVLERVGLRDWAEARGGLDSNVGEHGALVSGGQAARIALARVLLAEFPIVILDEPTAGVDVERADAMMRDMLRALPADRAVIVITHTQLPADIDRMRHLRLVTREQARAENA